MTEAQVAEQVEQFVRGQFSVSSTDQRFSRRVDLYEEAYVDSVGLAELLAFIEAELGVEVPDEELLSDDFATIEGIARSVCRLRGE